MEFVVAKYDLGSSARRGVFKTPHGNVETPVFMPVGTVGAVKGVFMHDLKEQVDAEIILGNTYHLYLRPGIEVLHTAGGLHRFNGWDRPILTDSGGFQVYSLGHRRKITEEGVWFQSHIDGSRHLFSPEKVMEIQRYIGADIIMAFDECPPWPSAKDYTKQSMEMTHRWLDRCIKFIDENEPLYGYSQSLFPIVQGGTFRDLRAISAEIVASKNLAGNAIGGLSVGEPADEMYAITELVCSILPEDKPRYLMGVGTPVNLLESVALGVDMFDCVMPTRNGRNGTLFTGEGVINIRNKKWQNDFSPLDSSTGLKTDVYVSKSYLRHLFVAGEMAGPMIASLHNLKFYVDLMAKARKKITTGEFMTWKNVMVKKLGRRL